MGLLTPLYNLPNNVLEKQRRYQNDHRMMPLRGPRGRLYFSAFTALFAVGMTATTWGTYNLVAGKPAE
ncbi:hypothetical protein BKA70DRAFT_1256913 [Coprinopsis sp. MPI-PUGE-AT-0042]|nr:hypothetical protein BKA70DRAFT_1256913 [Coprinopsis sp. MPI-PUGE-AT-0042]